MPKKVSSGERTEVLRQMLLEERGQVLKAVEDLLARRRMAQAEQRDDSVPDVADMALQDTTEEQQISLMELKNGMREQIDEALLRLADGRYGICEDCGSEISERRLKAVPFARRCIQCQEKTEEAIEQSDQAKSRSQI
ncbi:MAG TPA: TraR/DksA family transcriptional regulator [Nitrospirales bacterium]